MTIKQDLIHRPVYNVQLNFLDYQYLYSDDLTLDRLSPCQELYLTNSQYIFLHHHNFLNTLSKLQLNIGYQYVLDLLQDLILIN